MEEDDLEEKLQEYDADQMSAEDEAIRAFEERMEPVKTTEELDIATAGQRSKETYSIDDYQEDEFADTIEAKDYGKKEKFSDWRNSFFNAIDRIQQSGYKGDANKTQNEIDLIEKSLEEDGSLSNKERETLESQAMTLRTERKEHLDEVAEQQEQIEDYEVSEDFKREQERLLQEEYSSMGNYLKYELPEELGGTASQFGLLAGQAIKNKYGDKIIRGFIEKAAERAIVSLEFGEAAPFVSAALITYDVASTAADLYMMYQMRERETAAEANDVYEQSLQAKTMEYMDANQMSHPSQLSESEQRDLRIEANKGLEEFKDKQMIASLGDVMSYALLATKWGSIANKVKNFSRATRIGSKIGAIGAETFEEMTEEGYQFRLSDQFLAGKMSDDKSWLNTLGEGLETWKDDAIESLGVDDEYSTDVDYRNAKRSGGLLGGLMGGSMTAVGAVQDELNYEKLDKYNQKNLNNYFGPAQGAFKAKKFSEIINGGQSEMFRESMRNMKEGASVKPEDIDRAVQDFDVAESIHESLSKSRMFRDNPELLDEAFAESYFNYEVLGALSDKNKQIESSISKSLSNSDAVPGSLAELNSRKKAAQSLLSKINSSKQKPSNILRAKKDLETEIDRINNDIKELPSSEKTVSTLPNEELVVEQYFELYENKAAQKEVQGIKDEFSNPKKAYAKLKDAYDNKIRNRYKAIKKAKELAKKKIADAKTVEEVESSVKASKESIKDLTPEEEAEFDNAVKEAATDSPVNAPGAVDTSVKPISKQSNIEIKDKIDELIDGEGYENVPEDEIALSIDALNEELDSRPDKSDGYIPEDEVPAEETTPVVETLRDMPSNRLLDLNPATQKTILDELGYDNLDELIEDANNGVIDSNGIPIADSLEEALDSIVTIKENVSEAGSQQVDEQVPIDYDNADKEDSQSENLDDVIGKDNREEERYTGDYRGFRMWAQDKIKQAGMWVDRALGVLKGSVYEINYEYVNKNNIKPGDELEFFAYIPKSVTVNKATGKFYPERVRKTQLNSGVGDGLSIGDNIDFNSRNFSIGVRHNGTVIGMLPYVRQDFELSKINLDNYNVKSFDEPIQPKPGSDLVSFGGYTLNEIQSILEFRRSMYSSLESESAKGSTGTYTHSKTAQVGDIFKGRLNNSEVFSSPSEVFRTDDNGVQDPIVYAVSDANGDLTIPNEDRLTDKQIDFAVNKKIFYKSEKLTPNSVYVLMPAGNGDLIPIKTFIQRINVLNEASKEKVQERIATTLVNGSRSSMEELKMALLKVVGITSKNISVTKDSLVFDRKGVKKTLRKEDLINEEVIAEFIDYLSQEFVSVPFSSLNKYDFNKNINSDNSLQINITPNQYVHGTTVTIDLGKAEVTAVAKPTGLWGDFYKTKSDEFKNDKNTKKLTIDEALKLSSEKTSSTDKALLKALKPFLENTNVYYQDDYVFDETQNYGGTIDGEGNILIFHKGRLNAHAIIHEAMHELVYTKINSTSKSGQDNILVDELQRIFDVVKNTQNIEGQKAYGFTNLDEFVSEAFGNPEFRELLSKIEDKDGLKKGSIFTSVIDAIKTFLKESYNIEVSSSALESIFNAIEKSALETKTTTKPVAKPATPVFVEEVEVDDVLNKQIDELASEASNVIDGIVNKGIAPRTKKQRKIEAELKRKGKGVSKESIAKAKTELKKVLKNIHPDREHNKQKKKILDVLLKGMNTAVELGDVSKVKKIYAKRSGLLSRVEQLEKARPKKVAPIVKETEAVLSEKEIKEVVDEIDKAEEKPVVDLTGRKTFKKDKKTVKKEKLVSIHKKYKEVRSVLNHIFKVTLESLEYFQNLENDLYKISNDIKYFNETPEGFVFDNLPLLARTEENLRQIGSTTFKEKEGWFVKEGVSGGADFRSIADSIFEDSYHEGTEESRFEWSDGRDVLAYIEDLYRYGGKDVYKKEVIDAASESIKEIYKDLSAIVGINVTSRNIHNISPTVSKLAEKKRELASNIENNMQKKHDNKIDDDDSDKPNPFDTDETGSYRVFSADDMVGEPFDNESELNWLSEVLGIPVELVNSMKEVAASGGVEAWGMFANSMIYLMKSNVPGTTYHEAFHAVFRLMLNNEQRANIMKEAKGHFDAPTKSQLSALNKLHPKLSEEAISDLYYEEEMANAFMEYNLTDGLTAKSLPKRIADWFRKMYLAAKQIVTGNLNMKEYFFMINRGYYKNKQFSRDVSKFEDKAAFSVPNMNGIETKRSVDILNKQLLLEVIPKDGSLIEILRESSNPAKTLNDLYYDAMDRVAKAFNGHKGDNKDSLNYAAVKNSEEFMKNFIAARREIQHMATRDLAKFGIYMNPSTNSLTSSEEFFDEISETDELRGTLEGWMTDNFTLSAMDSLSEKLRVKLNYFPMMDESGNPKLDNGFPVYEDGFKFAQFLVDNIHDSFDVGELDENGKYSKFTMMGKLVEASKKKGSVDSLVLELQSDKNLTTDLFTAFAGKTRPNFYNFTQDENGKINMGISNKANKADVLKDHLFDSFMSLTSKQVEKYPDFIAELKAMVGSFKQGTDSIENNKNKENFLKIANVFGLDFFSDEINNAPDKVELNKALGKMAEHLSKILDQGKKLPSGNPMIDGASTQAANYHLAQLSKIAAVYKNSLTEDSFRDMNGKAYFSHVFPSFLSKQLWRLSQLGDVNTDSKGIYSEDSFYNNSAWFNNIVSDKKWKIGSDIKYGFLDGFKRDGDTKGTKYTKMSPNQLMSTFISAWSNDSVTTDSGEKMSFFPTSILADGGQMMMMGVPYQVRSENTETLVGTLKQEANRIIKNDNENKLPYKRKGEFLFDVGRSAKNILGGSSLEAANKIIRMSSTELADLVDNAMASNFKLFLDKLVEIQILDNTDGVLTIKDNAIDASLAKHDLVQELNNFYYGFMAAQNQITTLFAGDPAFYGSDTDFFKRIKQIYSPGTFLDLKAEFKGDLSGVFENRGLRDAYKTVYLKDTEVVSKHADTIFNNLLNVNTNPDLALKIASKYGYKHTTAKTVKRKKNGKEVDVEVNVDSKGNQYDIELINTTDAQAYVGIERYREIMIGRNKWSQKMEDALPDIIAGRATPAQLRLVMQPIKPFVFDHTLSHNTVVPIQNKNSEFLLLPQLAKGNPKLEDVLKGMGHVFGETPSFNMKNKLYDSVQFESAVKVGGNKEKYATSPSSITAENVNTIKNESYRIQMETPAHHVDYKNLFGIQVRKLVMGDIDKAGTYTLPNGSTLSGADMYKEYEELLSADIKHAFEKIREDFTNDDGTPNVRKVSEALQSEMNKLGVGEDFIKAVSYVEEGNTTNLPLYHPLISNKVENVVLAMFRNKVTKRQINGGSFINATSFGLDTSDNALSEGRKELEIVWNEDGTIKHYEAIMPAWTEKFTNKEGFFDINMLDEEARSAIMYRIPTEDFYSIFNIKVVGFTPSDSGGVIMLPSEVTTVAGLDFDVDKLFSMFYAIKKGKNGKFSKVDYTTDISKIDYLKRTTKGRRIIKEYQSSLNKLFESKKLFEGDSEAIEKALINYKEELESLSKAPGVIDAMFPNADIVAETEDVLKDKRLTEQELESISESINSNKKEINKLVAERDSKILELITDEEFQSISDIEKNSQEARDNRKIDIVRAVLTNKASLEKQLNPGNFDELKDLVEQYKHLTDTKSLSIDNPLTLLEMHTRNMTGRDLTGIFANHVSSHSQFQHSKLTFKKFLSWFGTPYSTIDDAAKYNTGGTGRISKTLASLLAAVLDNAKDPTASFLNINTYTADMYAAAIRLGIPLKDAAKFFNDPMLREFTELYYNYGGNTAAEKKAKSFIENKYNIKHVDYSRSLGISDKMSPSQTYHAFFEFKKSFSSPLGKATQAFRLDKKKSSRVADMIKTVRDVERVLDGKAIDGLSSLIDNTSMEAFYQHGTLDTLKMFSKLTGSPFSSASYGYTFRDIAEQIVGDLNADEIHDVNHELMNALFISDEYFSYDKEYLLEQFPIDLEIDKLKYTKDYDILKYLSYIPVENSATGYAEISSNSVSNIPDVHLQFIKDSWSDMYNNPETAETAINLAKYALLKSGFKRSRGSVSHLIPVDLLNNMVDENNVSINERFKNAASIIKGAYSSELTNKFYDQYVKNNYRKLRFVKEVEINEDYTVDVTMESGLPSSITMTSEYGDNNAASIDDDNIFVPTYIKLKFGEDHYLYKVTEHIDKQIVDAGGQDFSRYELVDTLGVSGVVKEYDMYSPLISSFSQNMVASELDEDYFDTSKSSNANEIGKVQKVNVLMSNGFSQDVDLFKKTVDRSNGVLPKKLSASASLTRTYGQGVIWIKDYPNDSNSTEYSVYDISREIESIDEETGEVTVGHKIDFLSGVDLKTGLRNKTQAEVEEVEGDYGDHTPYVGGDIEISNEDIKSVAKSISYTKVFVPMDAENVDKLLDGTKTTTVRTKEIVPVGQTKIATIGGVEFNITNRGKFSIEEAGGKETILKSEGLESVEDALFPTTKKWLNGEGEMFVYDIAPVNEIPDSAIKDWKASDKRKALVEKKKINDAKYSSTDWEGIEDIEFIEDEDYSAGIPEIDEFEEDESATTVSDGVDFVFNQSSELSKVGSPEQYSDYLKTVFPESKVRNIVYHGGGLNKTNLYFTDSLAEATLYENSFVSKTGKVSINSYNKIYNGVKKYFINKYNINEVQFEKLFTDPIEEAYYEGGVKPLSEYTKVIEDIINKFNINILDLELIKDMREYQLLYNEYSIKSENDMMRQYDDTDFIKNKPKLDKLESELLKFTKDEKADVPKSFIINLENPVIEASEDPFGKVTDAGWMNQKLGHSIIRKKDTNMYLELGSEKDISRFKKFVENKKESVFLKQTSLFDSVEEIDSNTLTEGKTISTGATFRFTIGGVEHGAYYQDNRIMFKKVGSNEVSKFASSSILKAIFTKFGKDYKNNCG